MFFKSLKAKNFRGLYSLDARDLNLINIIGGLNGSGKTTILEALFAIVDINDPTTLVKPFGWRNVPAEIENIASFFFSDGDLTKQTSLDARTNIGRIGVEYRYEAQPTAPTVAVKVNQEPASQQSNSQLGITARASINNHPAIEGHLQNGPGGGLQGWGREERKIVPPKCVMLTRKTIDSGPDLTARFSSAVQRKEKTRVLQFARYIIPEIQDLILLQFQGNLQLCGSIEPEAYVPISFLGDGALSMISIGMAIIEARGGVVFLDEFESTVHYTKLKTVWREIVRAAVEYDCQIFAVTHSKEAIEYAIAGAREADAESKIKYMRIDKINKQNKVTEYSFDELDTAIDEGWEIR